MSNNPVQSRALWTRPDRWIAAILAATSFAIHLVIALQLDAVRSFDQQDVFFHADTRSRLECTVEGRCAGRSTIAHPSIALFVNLPVGAVAFLLASRGTEADAVVAARRSATIWLSPLATGLQSGAAFFFFLTLGLNRTAALLASLLGVVSYSGLVFGSIPESFALSHCLITLGFLLTSLARPGANPRWGQWFALGVIATGITVTNLVSVAILFVTARLNADEGWWLSGGRCLQLMAAIGVTTSLLAVISHGLYESRPLEASEGVRYIKTWSRNNDPLIRAAQFPTALANSIVATNPTLADNYQGRVHDARYQFRFSLEGLPGVFTRARPFATVLLLLAAIGALAMLRAQPQTRNIATAALVIVICNFTLHAFWGVELLLYSLHWLQAFSLLTVGMLFLPARFETAGIVLLGIFTAAIGANNYNVGLSMLEHFATRQ